MLIIKDKKKAGSWQFHSKCAGGFGHIFYKSWARCLTIGRRGGGERERATEQYDLCHQLLGILNEPFASKTLLLLHENKDGNRVVFICTARRSKSALAEIPEWQPLWEPKGIIPLGSCLGGKAGSRCKKEKSLCVQVQGLLSNKAGS